MKTVGLITEYNPFHNGHAYHIQKAKELTRADYVVVIMSGNFVQRGTPAFLDKYTRAEIAVKHGADLILELPVIFSCGSAEYFAKGAIFMLNRTGIVDSICFGTENATVPDLMQAAKILLEEPEDFQVTLKSALKSGLSYPAARMSAMKYYAPEYAYTIASPNNLLGIEYMKALLLQKSSMQPYTLSRIHAGYHDTSAETRLYSATALRTIQANEELLSSLGEIDPLYEIEFGKTFPVENRDFDLIFGSKLLDCCMNHTLTDYPDISEALARTIEKNIHTYTGIDDFISQLKTKNLTYTRISRCMLHVMLDIRTSVIEEALAQNKPDFAQVLAFSQKGTALLGDIQKHLPLLIKGTDVKFKNEVSSDYLLLKQNRYADQLYRMVVRHKYGTSLPTEFTRNMKPISN